MVFSYKNLFVHLSEGPCQNRLDTDRRYIGSAQHDVQGTIGIRRYGGKGGEATVCLSERYGEGGGVEASGGVVEVYVQLAVGRCDNTRAVAIDL